MLDGITGVEIIRQRRVDPMVREIVELDLPLLGQRAPDSGLAGGAVGDQRLAERDALLLVLPDELDQRLAINRPPLEQ